MSGHFVLFCHVTSKLAVSSCPYCIPSCISHRPLPTYQLSLKSKKLLWTYGWTDVRTGGRTFETYFIRSTRGSRPNNLRRSVYSIPCNRFANRLCTCSTTATSQLISIVYFFSFCPHMFQIILRTNCAPAYIPNDISSPCLSACVDMQIYMHNYNAHKVKHA